jgi:MYXO-CTERM domain-containing protein
MRETPSGSTETNAVAAFDGVRFTVVWRYVENLNEAGTPCEVLSMQVDESGAPLAAEPRVLPGLGDFAPRALVAGGGARLLVLAPSTSYASDAPLSVVRLDESGALVDATPREFSEPGETVAQTLTGSVFDGTAFELALLHQDGDLHVARLGTDGALLAEGSLVDTTEKVFGGALASAGDGRALLGYSRFEPAPSYASTRAFIRVLGDGGECTTERVCDEATCSDCCTRGCAPVTTQLACTVTTCDGSCPEGTHCESGLVCRPDPPVRAGKLVYTKGCGCRVARKRDSRGGALLALGVTLLLAVRRRARRSARRTRSVRIPLQTGE